MSLWLRVRGGCRRRRRFDGGGGRWMSSIGEGGGGDRGEEEEGGGEVGEGVGVLESVEGELEGGGSVHWWHALRETLTGMHDGLDVPWWAAISGVTVLFRTLCIPLSISAFQFREGLSSVKEEMTMHRTKALAYIRNGTAEEAAEENRKIKALTAAQGGQLRGMGASVAQAGFFYGMYRSIESLLHDGTTAAEMKTEGLGWLQDLSSADPYHIAPFIAAGTTWILMRVSQDRSTSKEMPLALGLKVPTILVLRLSAIAVGAFTWNLSSAYFFLILPNALLSTALTYTLKHPAIYPRVMKKIVRNNAQLRTTRAREAAAAMMAVKAQKNTPTDTKPIEIQSKHPS